MIPRRLNERQLLHEILKIHNALDQQIALDQRELHTLVFAERLRPFRDQLADLASLTEELARRAEMSGVRHS